MTQNQHTVWKLLKEVKKIFLFLKLLFYFFFASNEQRPLFWTYFFFVLRGACMHCNNLKLLCSVVMFVLWYTYMCPCSYVVIQISDEWQFCKRELYLSHQTDIIGKEFCNPMDLHFSDFWGDLLFNLFKVA